MQGFGGAGPRRSAQRPHATMPTTDEASVPPKASAYSGNPSSACATVGIAVATASASNAYSATSTTAPIVVPR